MRAQGRAIPERLLRHVSPQTWEYINLTGIYSWATEPPPDTFRPLRLEADLSPLCRTEVTIVEYRRARAFLPS